MSVEAKCLIGRPESVAVSGMISVALGVKRRTRRSVSRKMVAISVLSSRFFMSSLVLAQLVDAGLKLRVDGGRLLVE